MGKIIAEYQQYFISNEEQWINTLKQVSDYIDINDKRPSNCDKNPEIKQLGSWISMQLQNYANNEYIMKDPSVRKLWEEFIVKYKKFFSKNKTSVIKEIQIKDKIYLLEDSNVYIKLSDGVKGKLYGTYLDGKFKKLPKKEVEIEV